MKNVGPFDRKLAEMLSWSHDDAVEQNNLVIQLLKALNIFIYPSLEKLHHSSLYFLCVYLENLQNVAVKQARSSSQASAEVVLLLRIDLRLLAASSASRCLGSKRRRSLSESASKSESNWNITTAASEERQRCSLITCRNKNHFSGFQNSQEVTTRFEMVIIKIHSGTK